jgi:hypothetical protein
VLKILSDLIVHVLITRLDTPKQFSKPIDLIVLTGDQVYQLRTRLVSD